jgi:hypothetical protein
MDAEFSPDGEWMACRSNEKGQGKIYVQAFPGPGGIERVSPRGGMSPALYRTPSAAKGVVSLPSALLPVGSQRE